MRPDRGERQPDQDGRLDADALDELLGEPGAGDDPEGHGQEREAGLQRRVAEDLLHVERGEEEHPEEAADDDEEDARWRSASVRTRKIPRRTSGATERRSMSTKAARSATATALRPSVCSEPQPFSCALTIA